MTKHRTGLYLMIFLLLSGCVEAAEEDQEADSPATAFENPPEWAKTAIWYQIMVDRFRNGDPGNDPTLSDIEGASSSPTPLSPNWQPTRWTQDWYREDPYFAAYDRQGLSFDQKVQLRRYGGDLQGVLDKIPYLDSLGITAVYFNPLNDAPSLHKYDARNWRHIDRNFGPDPTRDEALISGEIPEDPATWSFTAADKLFLRVIRELHQRGIRVILDYSWNHTGLTFWAWQDLVQQQQQSSYADWYWVEQFDDPATPENEFTYRGWVGVKELPEIKETALQDHSKSLEPFEGDLASETVKQHIFNITKRWLDPNGDGDPSDGVDGFRLDVAAEMPLGFWRAYRKVVRDVNPDALLIGEIWWEAWPDKLLDPELYLRGDIFDAVMNYRWYRSARHFFNAAPDAIPVSELVGQLKALTAGLRPESNFAMMNLVSSHDAPRVATSLFNKNKYKYYANPSQDTSYKIHRPDAETYRTLRLLLVHQFTYLGAPHIWAGDEMGMWGADDPSPRKPLIWPDYNFDPETTHPLGLKRPSDEVKFNQSLFSFFKKMIAIRRSHPVLMNGAVDFVLVDDANQLLAYSRYDGAAEVIAVFNAATTTTSIAIPVKTDLNYQDLLNGTPTALHNKVLTMQLAGREAAILVSR